MPGSITVISITMERPRACNNMSTTQSKPISIKSSII
uniref:Uncharacterized protein n=1 Tax=Arundo donax TaxID=35708 RepID=A0A0A9ALQ6_ARUDO